RGGGERGQGRTLIPSPVILEDLMWHRSRTKLDLRRLLPALVLGAGLALFPPAGAAQQPTPPAGPPGAGIEVDSILVRGNQRVDTDGIRVISGLPVDRPVTILDIQSAIRRLMGTRNFELVEVLAQEKPDGRVDLVIQVQERPLI